jgi:hypothetical protein
LIVGPGRGYGALCMFDDTMIHSLGRVFAGDLARCASERDVVEALSRGVYVNNLGSEGAERVKATRRRPTTDWSR